MTAAPKVREQWLHEMARVISPRIEEAASKEMPKYRVSCGFPATGALSNSRRRIGECWASIVSSDKVTEMFISPLIHDPVEVAAVLAHELIHCIDECKNKHRRPFAKLATAIGLEGKPTATHAGKELKAFLASEAKKLGDYPHGGMKVTRLGKVQTTRLVKVMCRGCGYTARTTRVWLEAIGTPLCACNSQPMMEAS